jgi:hypothetical protein
MENAGGGNDRATKELLAYFGDSTFDAVEYARGFYDRHPASKAPQRVDELENLKRQAEDVLRSEVVKNYHTFMQATDQVRAMEKDISRLRMLLSGSRETLEALSKVSLTEEEAEVGSENALGAGKQEELLPGKRGQRALVAQLASQDATARGVRLPEWLEKAPTELEELVMERKHEEACKLILRVRDFGKGVSSLSTLGQGLTATLSAVDDTAQQLARRLLDDITEAATFTPWGFREHRANFALLIELGHADEAAAAFVAERTSLIRRTLRMTEVTADPLTYVKTVSSSFFGQAQDSVRAFLRLFCGPKRRDEGKPHKSGRSRDYLQVHAGVKKCGSRPFCRLVAWIDQQLLQYALLVGRQVRSVTMAAYVARGGDAQLQPYSRARRGSNISHGMSSASAGSRLGPMAMSLFGIVSLMLEEVFQQAAQLAAHGLPVAVPLAARLSLDVGFFLREYSGRVGDALEDSLLKDAWQGLEMYRMLPPEQLLAPETAEGEDEQATHLTLTRSGSALAREVRDMLEYSMSLLDPATEVWDADTGEIQPKEHLPPYSREQFLEVEPQITACTVIICNRYLKAASASLERLREAGSLTEDQASNASRNLKELGSSFLPCVRAWCEELMPGTADDESVSNLAKLAAKYVKTAEGVQRFIA